jgi:hypothetical protein
VAGYNPTWTTVREPVLYAEFKRNLKDTYRDRQQWSEERNGEKLARRAAKAPQTALRGPEVQGDGRAPRKGSTDIVVGRRYTVRGHEVQVLGYDGQQGRWRCKSDRGVLEFWRAAELKETAWTEDV